MRNPAHVSLYIALCKDLHTLMMIFTYPMMIFTCPNDDIYIGVCTYLFSQQPVIVVVVVAVGVVYGGSGCGSVVGRTEGGDSHHHHHQSPSPSPSPSSSSASSSSSSFHDEEKQTTLQYNQISIRCIVYDDKKTNNFTIKSDQHKMRSL